MTIRIKMPKFLRKANKKRKDIKREDSAATMDSSVSSTTEMDMSISSLPWEGGKFFSPISSMNGSRSINSNDDFKNEEGCDQAIEVSWKSTEQDGYHKHAPLVAPQVLVAQQDRGTKPNPSSFSEEICNLDITLKRAAQLPRNNYLANNCVMVNRERETRKVTPMNRSVELDNIARWHAESMAAISAGAFQPDASKVQANLRKPCRRVGCNVGVGESIRDIHSHMMKTRSMFNNIVDRRYVEMGMATAKGQNGELYLCQIFRN